MNRQAFVRASRQASAPEWMPLQLRHTAATVVRSRFGLEAAQVVLGHARADVTQVYPGLFTTSVRGFVTRFKR